MNKQLIRLAVTASLSSFLWSCNQSDPTPKGNYVQGVFVINEGNFSQNNGAVSFFTREQTTAEADIFSMVNNAPLNGGVQGYAEIGDLGVVLVDNSGSGLDKAVIVNSNTFETVTTIGASEIENPREIVAAGNKVYISCWGSNADYSYKTGYIAVIELPSNRFVKKININSGPENLVYNNGKLYVGTVSYGGGKTLTVINTSTDEIEKTIALNGAPAPIGIDANGKLWVSAGTQAIRMNTETNTAEATLAIGTDQNKSASNFTFSSDRKTIFFVLSYSDANYISHGETYKFGITDAQIDVNTPFIKRLFTGLSVDPSQGLIYAAVTPSYAQAGYAVRYRTDGSLVDSIKVGVAPTGFFFK
ncbi:YncE family protein [Dyadobacter sediminis]|uniref:DUF5074 domain-containing protein n=1 Tax=Dyadobacter sediminis TaxID=1493691 RepID=A0A5R9K6Z5_9BACT|nr:DUF5074 domain-containing protein [Dyadobacter sediminis]TLU89549.1 hypothetical protein FEM55_22695 [Dyadobacter sediminis]GGC04378.1 hypothetical protein GCM10011325_34200 [Dyadobacter sediminis]